METELIRELISLIKDIKAEGMPVELISFFIIGIIVLFASFFGSYIRRKGQNLATKEDISEITKKIEEIRADYAKQIENLSHHNRLKMAALDKRLEAHQQAYTLWLQLRRSVHSKEKSNEMVIKCQKWWVENCLYLDMESRNAFMSSVYAVALHTDLTRGQATKEEVKENWKYINECGEIIIKCAGLPSFGENELEEIDKIDESKAKLDNSTDKNQADD
ncbi:hypothetical protein ACFL6P_01370 [Candidatus Latescibacterota bacterium]